MTSHRHNWIEITNESGVISENCNTCTAERLIDSLRTTVLIIGTDGYGMVEYSSRHTDRRTLDRINHATIGNDTIIINIR